jgi:hypothetical protein
MYHLYEQKRYKLSKPKEYEQEKYDNYKNLLIAACNSEADTIVNVFKKKHMQNTNVANNISSIVACNEIDSNSISTLKNITDKFVENIMFYSIDKNVSVNESYKFEDDIVACTIVAAMRNGDINCLKALASNIQFSNYMKQHSNKFLYQHLFMMHCYKWNHHQDIVKQFNAILSSGCFDVNQCNHDCRFTWAGTVLDFVKGHGREEGFHSSFYLWNIKWNKNFIKEIEAVLVQHGAQPGKYFDPKQQDRVTFH